MAGVNYTEYELDLEPGSEIFIYTDGLPEATNGDKEMFGTDRMLVALNEKSGIEPYEVLENVKKEIDEFIEGEEQFDDLTMLCLKLNRSE